MRTFAQKQKPAAQTKSTSFTKSGRPHSGQSREVRSILQLQPAHDVSRIAVYPSPRNSIQPKLKVNAPGDIYEQEADRITDKMMRQELSEREEDQKVEIQAKQSSDAARGGRDINDVLPNQLERSKGAGSPLPHEIRACIEPRLGHDFSKVRVHTDNEAARMNEELGARAFTHGQDIYFHTRQYDPQSNEGVRLLVHELTHVVQQGSVGQQVTTGHGSIQRQERPSRSSESGAATDDLQDLLRQLPVGTPEEVDTTSQVLSAFWQLRAASVEGASGITLPPVAGIAFSVPALIAQLQQSLYTDAALTLLNVAGDAASVAGWLTTAALEAGAISSATSAVAQAGVVAGLIGEAAGPAAIAFAVLYGVFTIPSGVNENLWKMFYIADASGIVTSWVFNDRTISPHSQLQREARSGGYMDTDLSDAVAQAHRRAHEYWQNLFSGHPERVRQVRQAAGEDYRVYWRHLGGLMESRLQPSPAGIAVSKINNLMHGVQRRREERSQREETRRREEAFQRRGGYVGELFIPGWEE